MGSPVLIGCSPTPVRVEGLNGVTAITAGANHNLALLADETIWGWGANTGRVMLGLDAPESRCDFTSCSRIPTRVPVLIGVTAVAAGASHNLALRDDGAVWAWGVDANGQLGCPSGACGRLGCDPTPGHVSDMSGVIAIAAGGKHSLALGSDGIVWAWGQDFYGQVGLPSSFSTRPAPVDHLMGVTAIAAGPAHSLAVRADGTVWIWRANAYGYAGRPGPDFCCTESGLPITCSPTPSQVDGLRGVSAIAAGGAHNLAVEGGTAAAPLPPPGTPASPRSSIGWRANPPWRR